MPQPAPIGWWIKRLDALLDQVVDAAVSGDGLSRRHWQVLHRLAAAQEPVELTGLAAELAPFTGVDGVVEELQSRGWLSVQDAGLQLTLAGRAAHERLFAEVGRLRRQVTEGLTAEEYQATIAALARMVANAEGALAVGAPAGAAPAP